jgi:hypothetical protein
MVRKRKRFEGTWKIVRFNWPLYAAAFAVMVAAGLGPSLVPSFPWQIACILVGAASLWFLAGSLVTSYLVYDRSDLHRGAWLTRALEGRSPGKIAACHCGYDEISGLLRDQLPGADLVVLDHYDETTMSEPSIRRARRLFPPGTGTIPTSFARWPIPDGQLDTVFGVLAIHELRAHTERAAWFTEARRCLAKTGRIVVVEHLRDLANFAAFGPGFVHFHASSVWRRSWEEAGLRRVDEFTITPFLRVFVLCRHD